MQGSDCAIRLEQLNTIQKPSTGANNIGETRQSNVPSENVCCWQKSNVTDLSVEISESGQNWACFSRVLLSTRLLADGVSCSVIHTAICAGNGDACIYVDAKSDSMFMGWYPQWNKKAQGCQSLSCTYSQSFFFFFALTTKMKIRVQFSMSNTTTTTTTLYIRHCWLVTVDLAPHPGEMLGLDLDTSPTLIRNHCHIFAHLVGGLTESQWTFAAVRVYIVSVYHPVQCCTYFFMWPHCFFCTTFALCCSQQFFFFQLHRLIGRLD